MLKFCVHISPIFSCRVTYMLTLATYHFSWGLIDTNKKKLAYGGSQPQITKNYAWFVSLSFID